MKPEAIKSPREVTYEAACTSAKSEFENMTSQALQRKLEMLNGQLRKLKQLRGVDSSTVAIVEGYRDTAALFLQRSSLEPTQISIPKARGDTSFSLLRKFFLRGKRG